MLADKQKAWKLPKIPQIGVHGIVFLCWADINDELLEVQGVNLIPDFPWQIEELDWFFLMLRKVAAQLYFR